MYTVNDYLIFRGDLSFETCPVNEIDEMVFASMGKANFSEVLGENETADFGDVFNAYFSMQGKDENASMGLLASPVMMKTLHRISLCPRYSGVKVSHFVNIINEEHTEQLSALTVHGPDGKIYVTFRGTDDTLVGWKENCMLAVLYRVPAQRDAAEYLDTIARCFSGPLVLCGHSKGGNLAIYAAAKARPAVQKRIEKIISYDGPGFMNEFLSQAGYQRIKDKIITMVPESSIVGMLMDTAGRTEVIACEKDGPAAHDIFMWGLGPDAFVRAGELSEKSRKFHKAINKTIEGMTTPERYELVDELFQVLSSTGAVTLSDFTDHTLKQAVKLAGKFRKAKEIRQFLHLLARFTIRGSIVEPIKQKIETSLLNEKKQACAEEKLQPASVEAENDKKS